MVRRVSPKLKSAPVCRRCGFPYFEHPIKTWYGRWGDKIEQYQVDKNCPNLKRQTGIKEYETTKAE